jgi:TonB family protein
MARQQVVDVAPGNDRVPNDARLLAESNNTVEKETVSRFAKAGAEHTTPRPTQNTQKAQAPLEPPRTLARPEVPSERAGGDSRKAGAPGAPAPQEQTPPRRADGERVAALFSPDGLLRSRPVVPPPPAPASQQPPGQGGEGGQGAAARPGGRPILEPSPAFFDQLSGNAFPDHVTGADVGDSTFLNTREWKYAGYFNRIKQSVAEHWNPNGALRARDPSGARFGSGEHVTVLTVTLGSDGRVKDIRVTRSSGLGFLDQSAIDAFASAQPFLHPPPGLADPQGEIRFPFGFHVAPQAGGFPFFGTPR